MGIGENTVKKVKRVTKYEKAEILGRLDPSTNSYDECLFMFRDWIKGQ